MVRSIDRAAMTIAVDLGRKATKQTNRYVIINLSDQFQTIKEVLAIRRIFSLVDMITKPKFSNCPNIFKIGLFR